MKIPRSLLFCLVVCCGFYGLSDGATIPTIINNDVEEVGSNGLNLLSTANRLLNCNSPALNSIPNPLEIARNPLQSIQKSICYIFASINNLSRLRSVTLDQPQQVFNIIITRIIEVLKNVYDSNLIPEPYASWLYAIINLYNINRLFMSTI